MVESIIQKLNYPEKLNIIEHKTPIVFLKRFTESLGLGVDIYLKRDDLTGMELSGNKIRKLEFLLADAIKQGCTLIITAGGVQSNHCRATAAACARLGLKCRMLLRTNEPGKPYDGNLLLDDIFGAKIDFIEPETFSEKINQIVDQICQEEEAAGGKAYYVPIGGSVPMGSWGYIRCFEEIMKQSEELGLKFDYICVAIGSGGTMVGLMLGRELLAKKDITILGFNVCNDRDYFFKEMQDHMRKSNKMFNLGLDVDNIPINIQDGYVGTGYAIPYIEEVELIKQISRQEGIVMDPVYTGKAFYGTIDKVRKGEIKKGSKVLFIHTGGLFANFALKEDFYR